MTDRESIWTVSGETRRLFFGIFTALFLASIGILIWRELEAGAGALPERILNVWIGVAGAALASAATAMLLSETGAGVMLLREKLESVREKRRAEGRSAGFAEGRSVGIAEGRSEGIAEGRSEGLTEERQRWKAWYERFEAARRRDEPFDEPPPSPPSEL